MNYLNKTSKSKVIEEKLLYGHQGSRGKIRKYLLKEQLGFCAYSEVYVRNIDSIHIEHFDPRLKNTDNDNYYNWYAVKAWMNENRPKKIDKYLPILSPYNDIYKRIKYENDAFMPKDNNDKEAINLIKFLGFNKPELVEDRLKHIQRLKSLKDLLNDDDFINHFKRNKEELSFITALESEFNIDFKSLL